MQQNTTLGPDWVKSSDLAKMFGVARNAFFRMAASGKFPKPVWLGRNARWNAQEVSLWIEAQKKGE